MKKTTLPIPPDLYIPPTLRVFPLGLAPQIGGLVQLLAWPKDITWTPWSESVSTLLVFRLYGRQKTQLTGGVCGSDPSATSCRSLPRGWSKLLLASCCWAPDGSFSVCAKNCCWCFPIRDMLWQAGGQCVHELVMKDRREHHFQTEGAPHEQVVSLLEAASADQPLRYLFVLFALTDHPFCHGGRTGHDHCDPSRRDEPAGHLRESP